MPYLHVELRYVTNELRYVTNEPANDGRKNLLEFLSDSSQAQVSADKPATLKLRITETTREHSAQS